MVIRPREMVNPAIYLLIRVPGAFGAELPNTPILAMFRVEEGDERVEWVAVCTLRIGPGGS